MTQEELDRLLRIASGKEAPPARTPAAPTTGMTALDKLKYRSRTETPTIRPPRAPQEPVERVDPPPDQAAWQAIQEAVFTMGPEMLGQTAGGIMGAAVGAGLGGPPGAVLGGMAGSGLGGGIGEAGRQLMAKKSVSIPEIADATTRGVISEGIGAGAAAAKTAVFQLAPRNLTAQSRRILDYFETLFPGKKPGESLGGLTPARAIDSGLLGNTYNILENVVSGSFLGRGIMKNFRDFTQKGMEEYADKWTATVVNRLPPQNIGSALISSANNSFRATDMAAAAMREELIQAAAKANVKVPAASVQQFVQRHASELRVAASEYGTTLVDEMERWLGSGVGVPALTVDTAIDASSRLKSIQRAVVKAKGVNTPGSVKAGQLAEMIDDNLEATLQLADPLMYKLWKQSQQAFRVNREVNRTKAMIALIKKAKTNPEVVGDVVMAGKLSDIENIREAMVPGKSLPGWLDPQRAAALKHKGEVAWKHFQTYVKESILSKAVDPATGRLEGADLQQIAFGKGLTRDTSRGGAKEILTIGGYGEDKLTALLGKKEVADLKEFTEALAKSQKAWTGIGSRVGSWAIEAAQIGSVGIATSGLMTDRPSLVAGAGFVILGPPAIAKLFTSPVGRRLLIRGLKTKAGTREAVAIGARLAYLTNTTAQLEQDFLAEDGPGQNIQITQGSPMQPEIPGNVSIQGY